MSNVSGLIHVSSLRIICCIPVMVFAALVVASCASTRFAVSGQLPEQPVCQTSSEDATAVILWGPRWRPNQKDVPLREAAAQRGIAHFFSSSGCVANATILRTVGDRNAIDLSPAEVRAVIAAEATTPQYVLSITVRELGPIVTLFSSLALVDGGTEVVLEIRALAPATGQSTSAFTAHWQNGGRWVLKGVATLEYDIACALQAALRVSRTTP